MGGLAFVHYCVFCGAHHDAEAATMLSPSCAECGCPLRACQAAEFPAIQAALAEQRQSRGARMDGAGPLAALVTLPWLLPQLGLEVRDVVFAVPLLFLVLAAVLCGAAAQRPGEPAGPWRGYAIAAGSGALATVVGIVAHVLGDDPLVAFRLGGLASLAMVGALALHVAPRVRWATAERILDVIQPLVLVVAAVVYFAIVPGVRDGDGLLTAIVAIDLVGFALAAVLAAGWRRTQDRAVARRLWAVSAFALLGDAVMAAGSAGVIGGLYIEHVAAVCYAVQGWFLAGAALSERPAPRPEDLDAPDPHARRRLVSRIAVPAALLGAFPALMAVAVAADGAGAWPHLWFTATGLVALLAAIARQAHVAADHRRAVTEERRQREAAQRRNEELEALTGLAATMTQTLEEAPIVEQALTVLHTAARATASAMHVTEGERRRLRATAGEWQAEHVWADGMTGDGEVLRAMRGRRQITQIPLAARGSAIGSVTFVRPAADPLTDRELQLLRLLVDQMAVAVHNARDYREKLEQAVRDPLTGVYNRRFFSEALEKEVQRSRRYNTGAALVLLDVDDFKAVNDSRGHAAGDDVLRVIARVAVALMRPADSFARIGGEEFALLLPETTQMEALLVAERLRAAIGREDMGDGLRVTVSAGIGACPHDAPSRDELMRRTDAALYWAKRNGKDMCATVNDVTDEATYLQAERPEQRVWTAAGHFADRVAAGEPVPEALADLRRALRI